MLTTHDFKETEETKAQKDNRFQKRTQTAFMICDYFKISGTSEAILDFTELMKVTLKGDSV